jgi:hypothetical protein
MLMMAVDLVYAWDSAVVPVASFSGWLLVTVAGHVRWFQASLFIYTAPHWIRAVLFLPARAPHASPPFHLLPHRQYQYSLSSR